jgi:glycosyltransferase involved in cell wall biosynthesis
MSERTETDQQADFALVSVVVPVYKNADTLRELQRSLSHVFSDPRLPAEMIYIDDACPAGSLAVLEDLARVDARVVVISLAHNIGQHKALLLGLRYARGEAIVMMDADLQDPPGAIPALLQELERGYAAVFAGRRGRYQSPLRMLSSHAFKTLLSVLAGVPRDAGAFVAVDRTIVEHLLAYRASRPFLVSLIGLTGLPVTSIPIQRSPRPRGRSAYSGAARLKAGLSALCWTLWWRLNPASLRNGKGWESAPIKAKLGARFLATEAEGE